VNRVISRDINKVAIDQVIYCCWCDSEGKVVDDGTITRLARMTTDGRLPIRVCAGFSKMRWDWTQRSKIFSEKTAALALQGPTSGNC